MSNELYITGSFGGHHACIMATGNALVLHEGKIATVSRCVECGKVEYNVICDPTSCNGGKSDAE